MKKTMSLILTLLLIAAMTVACGEKEVEVTEVTEATEEVDVVTTASIVDNGDALASALTAEGTWIVAVLNDVTYDSDLVVDGLFYDKDDETKDVYRKLALYTQDEDHNIIDQFTLTAPKLVVKSENFKVQGGTFVGDVYVEANGFNVSKSATIEGNIYFATQENMDTLVVDESAVITGTQEVQ